MSTKVMIILQKCIAILGVLLVVAINLLPDFFYVGIQHPVGSDAVQVYKYDAMTEDPTVPVYEFGVDGAPVDSGKRVHAYLRNDYRDARLLAKPNFTLIVIGITVVLYGLTVVVARYVVIPHHSVL